MIKVWWISSGVFIISFSLWEFSIFFFSTVIYEETDYSSTSGLFIALICEQTYPLPLFHFSEKGTEVHYSIMENVTFMVYVSGWDVNVVYKLMILGSTIASIFYVSLAGWKLPCNASNIFFFNIIIGCYF